jgi:hypothetical protein
MKPETLEAIKKDCLDLFPMADHLEKGMTGYKRTMDNRKIYTKGATKYAELLESEREKSNKLARALKVLQASINGGLDGLELDNPDEIIEKSEVIKTFKEHNELIEKALTEYKTTSK